MYIVTVITEKETETDRVEDEIKAKIIRVERKFAAFSAEDVCTLIFDVDDSPIEWGEEDLISITVGGFIRSLDRDGKLVI